MGVSWTGNLADLLETGVAEGLRLITLKAWDDGPSLSLLFLVLNHISEPIKESLFVQSLSGRGRRDLRGTQEGGRLSVSEGRKLRLSGYPPLTFNMDRCPECDPIGCV